MAVFTLALQKIWSPAYPFTMQGAAPNTRRPGGLELVYRETVADRGAAVRRECAIKRLRPVAKRKLIAESGEPKSTQEIRSLQ